MRFLTPEQKAHKSKHAAERYMANNYGMVPTELNSLSLFKNICVALLAEREFIRLEKRRASCRGYAARNRSYMRTRNREYSKQNRQKLREYEKNKLNIDLNFKLRKLTRNRINAVVRGVKSDHTYRLVGCTAAKLRNHLEQQFRPGMSWDNWSKAGWHIDHIRPCASFDLTDPEQQRKCFHYSNLQPLWAEENLKKGAKCNG